MKKTRSIVVWAALLLLFAGALVYMLLPRSLSALTGVDHAEIQQCGIMVMEQAGAGTDISGEALEHLLALLDDTKVKLRSSGEALDTLRTTRYGVHFYYADRDAISLVIWENGCIEYQNIVYEISGGGEALTDWLYQNV